MLTKANSDFKTELYKAESRGRIILPNGWEISLAWGGGMHGSNYDAPIGVPIPYSPEFEVEALCFSPSGEMVYSNGDVYTHLKQEWIKEVLIPWVSNLKEGQTDLPEQPWEEEA